MCNSSAPKSRLEILLDRELIEGEGIWITDREETPEPFYAPPLALVDTVFDPYSPTFGPIMAAIQGGEFMRAAAALIALSTRAPNTY